LDRYVKEYDIYLIEDDYDSEFPYYGESVTPPYVMDPKRVVYAVLSVKSCSLPSAQAMLS